MQSKKIFKLNNNDNFKFLKNKEELQSYVKVLIEYFNKNIVNKDFEKQLIRQLKNN